MGWGRRSKYYLLSFLDDAKDFQFQLRIIYIRYIKKIMGILFAILGMSSIVTLTIEFGFYYPDSYKPWIQWINQTIIYYLLFYEIINFILSENYKEYLLTHKPEFIIVSIILLQSVFKSKIVNILSQTGISPEDAALSFIAISQVFFIFSNLISFLRSTRIYGFKNLNPSFMFFASFGAIILLGTFALSMPKLHRVPLAFVDILFTVISATCVTGLSTVDISQVLSIRGQIVLLALIQVGGLGLITLTSFFAIFLAGQASVKDTMMMKDLLSEDAIGKVIKLIKGIAIQTFVIETTGAMYLFLTMPDDLHFDFSRKLFFSFFHSISAFCNAGFSLWSDSLAGNYIKNDFPFLFGICGLIVLGGLGFGAIREILQKFLYPTNQRIKISVSTKLGIVTSAILFFLGIGAYFFLEQKHTLQGMSLSEQLLQSFFFSVTTRTAGFNTLDLSKMGIPITFVALFFMWVGASPNSTGGGIKTTTLSISILNIINFITGKEKLHVFHRQIAYISQLRASVTIVLSLFVIFVAIFLLICFEDFSFLDICFEVVSAYGTVGLTRGITAQLKTESKLVICFVMFCGRVGILTILIAMIPKHRNYRYDYPSEYVIVG
jgi:Trk-type K+ transport system membrane component